ncbi:MAG TPA: hypothetical protein VH307_20215 [Streptosporangiaceae bacterium]|nr:hypothetical protein [Streptosporangiaceae bacterium]
MSGEHRQDGKRADTIERAETTIRSHQAHALHSLPNCLPAFAILVALFPVSAHMTSVNRSGSAWRK